MTYKLNNLVAYKLNFFTPLHLGLEGIGLERTDDILHSDTLFSAIICKWQLFYDDNIENFINNPPFILSSAFPFKGDNYFFPRPMIKIGNEQFKYDKKLKKIKFVSKNIFEKLINAEQIEFSEEYVFPDGLFWTDYKVDDLLDEEKIIYQKRETPRIVIDRETNYSEIFYFNEIIFSENCGLFFLVKFIDEKIKDKFETILRLLGDEGIGGDKSSGKGCFKVNVVENFSIKIPTVSEYFITLSLFYPAEDEIQNGLLQNSTYELITRTGWIHSISATSLRRKALRMFIEGSVFKNIKKDGIYGEIKNVFNKNDTLGLLHNVYRYGISFAIPIKRKENNV